MKRLKPEKKRLIVGIIAIFLIVTMIFGMVAPFVYGADFQGQKDISIKANIGFDGNVKINNMAPFQVILKNNSNSDFKGNLEIYVVSEYNNSSDSTLEYNNSKKDNNYIVFEQDVELASKSEKEFDFKINIDIIQRDIQIKVRDYKGNEIESENYTVNTDNNNKLWLGMISDNPEGIAYLKPQYYNVESETFLMDSKTFPDNKYILSNFDVFIINNFDINLFSDNQRKALYDWIYSGGFLLVGSGNYSSEINQQFKDERFKSINSIENIIDLNKESDNEADEYLYNNTDIKQFGKGYLIIHNFDLSEDILLNSVSFQNLLVNKYTEYTRKENSRDIIRFKTNKVNIERFNIIYYCTRLLNFTDKHTIQLIIILVYFYAILIGPILYAVLKKKDKREYAIFIIPVISLSFTFVIYILSFNTVYKKPMASAVSYLDLDNLDKNVNNNIDMEIGLNLSSPEKGTIKMEFNKDLFLKSISSDNDVQSEYRREILTRVETNDKTSVTKYDSRKWNSNFIKLIKNVNIKGTIDLNLYIENKAVKGTITNNTGYDLKDIVMGIGGIYYKYDFLKSGEEIDIGSSGINFILDNISYAYEKYSEILTDGSRYEHRNKDMDLNRIYELELKQDIVSGIIELNNSELGFTMVAFTDDAVINEDIITNGKKTIISSTNVLKVSKVFDISDFKSIIPFGFIKAKILDDVVNMNNKFESKTYDIDISNTENNIEIKFDIPKSINLNSFKIEWDLVDGKGKIYNYSSKSWENVSQMTYDKNTKSYINDNNEIHLMYEKGEDMASYMYLPEIEVILNN